MRYYNKSITDTLRYLEVNKEFGLDTKDIGLRRAKYGYNEFTIKEGKSILDEIFDNIMEPMILILLAAAVISAFAGEVHDAFGILGAIFLGLSIGAITESKSKKAAQALSKLTENIEVKVLRNGKIQVVPKKDLVPGDIVFIESGDLIPADGRLIESINLKLREDMLTGESNDVLKDANANIKMDILYGKTEIIEQDTIPANQKNMVFGGTLVAYGRGKMVVTGIGDATEMGKIAQNIGDPDVSTPLQIKLGKLGAKIAVLSGIVAFLLCLFMIIKMTTYGVIVVDTSGFIPFIQSLAPAKNAYMVCIALIVATVPEGLPTMVNITLAITMQKMAKINALVTKKEACETIGCVSVICSDKTGTLTQNKMKVITLAITMQKMAKINALVTKKEACETIGCVSVICSDKTGTLTQNKMKVEVAYVDGKYIRDCNYESHSFFEENCLSNSTADIEKEDKSYKYIGSATECALLLFHNNKDYVDFRRNTKLVSQIPFSSEKKRMSSLIEVNQRNVLLSKGAPEILLERCTYYQDGKEVKPITQNKKKEILHEISKLQVKSMRTLGFAYKVIDGAMDEVAMTVDTAFDYSGDMERVEDSKDLIFSGFVGIVDPLRKGVKESIETAYEAGVKVKMLTGDNINTARAIGTELGLLNDNKKVVEATYIDILSDEELREEINDISIVARSKPETKMRIVQALQANSEVVAVTGDGINDAPALSKADVGISMGISGTEVSKNASDIILTDDSFSTIVDGIKWGRGIYENFQRFIQFQLTINIVAFMIAVISQIMGKEMPFTTIQLLWVNIIMDGPPALALGLEPVRKHVLDRPPIHKNASIITKSMMYSMIGNALLMTCLIYLQIVTNFLNVNNNEQGTVTFALFAFLALFNALNCREFNTESIIPNFFKNKVALEIIGITGIAQIVLTQIFTDFFSSVPLDLMTWIKIILASFSIIV